MNPWPAFVDLFSALLVVTFAGFIMLFGAYWGKVNNDKGEKKGIETILTETETSARQLVEEVIKELKKSGVPLSPCGSSEIHLPANILFSSGGYNDFLADVRAKEILEKIGVALREGLEKENRRRTLKIMVEGHTDNEPISQEGLHIKGIPTNWELSTRRATEVVRYLSETCKLDQFKYNIVAVGYGEHRPLVPNYNPDGSCKTREEMAPNRRIAFRIIPDYEEIIKQPSTK